MPNESGRSLCVFCQCRNLTSWGFAAATTDPPKYCQLLIRELELADERLTTELGILQSDDENEM